MHIVSSIEIYVLVSGGVYRSINTRVLVNWSKYELTTHIGLNHGIE